MPMPLDLQSFRNSLTSLSNLLDVSESDGRMLRLGEVERDGIRAGVIQNFEVTYELAWKLMSRWLSENVGRTTVDGVTRRQLFRLAAEHRLIEDVDHWMSYHIARNQTSHMYNQEVAYRVYGAASGFVQDARRLLAALEERND